MYQTATWASGLSSFLPFGYGLFIQSRFKVYPEMAPVYLFLTFIFHPLWILELKDVQMPCCFPLRYWPDQDLLSFNRVQLSPPHRVGNPWAWPRSSPILNFIWPAVWFVSAPFSQARLQFMAFGIPEVWHDAPFPSFPSSTSGLPVMVAMPMVESANQSKRSASFMVDWHHYWSYLQLMLTFM